MASSVQRCNTELWEHDEDENERAYAPALAPLLSKLCICFSDSPACWCEHGNPASGAEVFCASDACAHSSGFWRRNRLFVHKRLSYAFYINATAYVNMFCDLSLREGGLPFSGHCYFEVEIMSLAEEGVAIGVGVAMAAIAVQSHRSSAATPIECTLASSGMLRHNEIESLVTDSFSAGTRVGVYVDADRCAVTFFKNSRAVVTVSTAGNLVYCMISTCSSECQVQICQAVYVPSTSLQYLCCLAIRGTVRGANPYTALPIPDALKERCAREYPWLVYAPSVPR